MKTAFTIILFMLFGGVTEAQDIIRNKESFSINGKVIHADTQKEIVGATLTITSLSEHHISDKTGNFEFTISPGNYELKISKDGFKSVTKNLKLTKKDIHNLIVSLEPEH